MGGSARRAIIGVIAAFVVVSGARADTPNQALLDGLSAWGINLQAQATSSTSYTINKVTGYYNAIISSSLVPTKGINYAVQGGTAPESLLPILDEDNGGGFCSVEAVYATRDAKYAYFAVITNSNPNGTSWDGYGSARFGPGDLSVTVTNTKTSASTYYGIGARPIALDTPQYGAINYGTTDMRNTATWGNAYTPSATNYTSFSTHQAMVVATDNPKNGTSNSWSHVDNEGGDEANMVTGAYFIPSKSTSVGSAWASWTELTGVPLTGVSGATTTNNPGYEVEDIPPGYDGDLDMQPYSTWLYEVAVPLDALGIATGDTLSITFAPDCGNDSLTLGTSASFGGPPVPEPISMIFFVTGLVGVGGYMARRKMQRR